MHGFVLCPCGAATPAMPTCGAPAASSRLVSESLIACATRMDASRYNETQCAIGSERSRRTTPLPCTPGPATFHGGVEADARQIIIERLVTVTLRAICGR